MFVVLLSKIVNGSNHQKCVSLKNHKYQTTGINLHPYEYIQKGKSSIIY